MGHQPSDVKFAVVGHLESWEKILRLVNLLRSEEGNAPLAMQQVKEMYSFFPPTKIFDARINAGNGKAVEGFYIETFISPDELTSAHLWQNMRKVKLACEKAASLGASIVSLGGFTSIVLESGAQHLTKLNGTSFTTGNALTAAFVVEAAEAAAEKISRLNELSILIIGSTGDIGSACVRYFAGRARRLLLSARTESVLQKQITQLRAQGVDCKGSVQLDDLLPESDIVISAASSSVISGLFHLLPAHAVICDAGYPKNITANSRHQIFQAGMGVVSHGLKFSDEGYRKILYDFTVANTLHGCILESIVLAMEENIRPFSSGRGNITVDQMSEIHAMARRNGINALLPSLKTRVVTS